MYIWNTFSNLFEKWLIKGIMVTFFIFHLFLGKNNKDKQEGLWLYLFS